MHSHLVQFTSDYQLPAVEHLELSTFHRISLIWDPRHLESGGTLTIDPNTCRLDDFGYPTSYTTIAVHQELVKMALHKAEGGKRAYSITRMPLSPAPGTTPVYEASPLRLVTIAEHAGKPMQARMVVLNEEGAVERVIELHHKA